MKQIIDVGGKEFKFTWSGERGDLCDIYEEHQSGEDENGVLIEAGSAWRKLNVQRTLDESITSQMKKRSVEAEQKNKSRKYVFQPYILISSDICKFSQHSLSTAAKVSVILVFLVLQSYICRVVS